MSVQPQSVCFGAQLKPTQPKASDVVPYPADLASKYRDLGLWTGQGLFHILEHGATLFADHPALIDGARSWSYLELRAQTLRAASRLLSLGIAAGERVVLQLPNGSAGIISFFALQRIGAVPVLALPGHRLKELESFAEQTGAVAYIGTPHWDGFDYTVMLRALEQKCPQLRSLIWTDPSWGVPLDSIESVHRASKEFELWTLDAPAESPLCDLERPGELIALLQLSGGSTGTPKLIPRTADDYFYSVRCSAQVCGWTPSTRLLVVLPFAHNFPMSSPGFLGALWAGGCVVLAKLPHFEVARPLLIEHGITVTSLVPPLAQAWLRALGSDHFPTLRTIQVGGAKLSETLARALVSGFRCQLQQVFGMAEGLVCYTRDNDPEDVVYKTQGRPMSAWDEVRVVDEDDRDVPSGSPGHLLARGPYTIRGYFRASEHNARTFTADGYYRTGDIVAQDEQGNLTVVGRAKEQINRGGEKIAPAEIEDYLLRHPQVLEASVVGVPDEHLGERSCAFLVMRPGSQLDRIQLVQFLRELSIAAYKIPDRWEQVDSLQATSTYKVDKGALKEQACFNYAALREHIAELLELDAEQLKPDDSLLDFGLDSLRLVALVEHLAKRGKELSFFDVASDVTLRNLARLSSLELPNA